MSNNQIIINNIRRLIRLKGLKQCAVAEKAGLTKKDVEKTITATLETVKEVVAKGDKVQVVGFGTFEARARKEREGKNPQNGEKVVIPAATIPAFKAGKAFKDAVNVK